MKRLKELIDCRLESLAVFFSILMMLPALASANLSESDTIVLWYRNYDSPAVHRLLQLALQKTPEYGDYTIVRSREMSQGRALLDLESNNQTSVMIANVAASPQREEKLNTIQIPLNGGLLGYRVCVIEKEDQKLFDGIRSLDDFRQKNLRVGQGAHWPDAEILRANDINVVTTTHFESLFGMLEKNRFDCFARSISEVSYDLMIMGGTQFAIEKNLLFIYNMPSYFFVSRENEELAYRVQLGLERAIIDGSFVIFLDHYYIRPIQHLHLQQRVVIPLHNPWVDELSL